MNGFVYRVLRKTTVLRTFETPLVNTCFRVVEAQNIFAAKFTHRNQSNDEMADEYATAMKRLYAKANDEKTRQEDLVRRFLDHEARFEIEFYKEPDDIDNAFHQAVNFLQTRRRSYRIILLTGSSRDKLAEPVNRVTQKVKCLSDGTKMKHMNSKRRRK